MINSTVLRTAAEILKPLMLLFSIYVLIRGHNEPGGGFSGGLLAASGFLLDAFARGVSAARESLRVSPSLLIGTGLLIAIGSGLPGLVADGQFLSGQWYELTIPGLDTFKAGTPLIFDIGVYLAVIGVALTIVLTVMEAQD